MAPQSYGTYPPALTNLTTAGINSKESEYARLNGNLVYSSKDEEFNVAKNKNVASLKPGAGQSIEQQDGSIVKVSPTIDEIARRAYDIYLERGSGPGQDLDNWFQAERELKNGGHS